MDAVGPAIDVALCNGAAIAVAKPALAKAGAPSAFPWEGARLGVADNPRATLLGQNDPAPFDTARRLALRSTNLLQTLPLLRISRQRNHPARCYH